MNTKLTTQLARHVADTQVLWNKFHNLHWNVRGTQFRTVHALTEELYDALGEQFDALAERLLMLGAQPPVSLKACLELTGVTETDQTRFTSAEVLALVRADLESLVTGYKATRALAADLGDSTTDALLAGFIADFEKQIWVLASSQD